MQFTYLTVQTVVHCTCFKVQTVVQFTYLTVQTVVHCTRLTVQTVVQFTYLTVQTVVHCTYLTVQTVVHCTCLTVQTLVYFIPFQKQKISSYYLQYFQNTHFQLKLTINHYLTTIKVNLLLLLLERERERETYDFKYIDCYIMLYLALSLRGKLQSCQGGKFPKFPKIREVWGREGRTHIGNFEF